MHTCVKCNEKISWWQAEYEDSGKIYHLECWENMQNTDTNLPTCDFCNSDLDQSYWKTEDHKKICKSCKERHEKALKHFTSITPKNSSPIAIWLHKANYFYQIGNYSEARKCLEKFVNIEKNNCLHWIIASHQLESMGNYETAVRYLEEAIKFHPGDNNVSPRPIEVDINWQPKDGIPAKCNSPHTKVIYIEDIPPKIVLNMDIAALLKKIMQYNESIPYYIKALELEHQHEGRYAFGKIMADLKYVIIKGKLSASDSLKYEKIITHYTKLNEERCKKHKAELKDYSKKHKEIRDVDEMLK